MIADGHHQGFVSVSVNKSTYSLNHLRGFVCLVNFATHHYILHYLWLYQKPQNALLGSNILPFIAQMQQSGQVGALEKVKIGGKGTSTILKFYQGHIYKPLTIRVTVSPYMTEMNSCGENISNHRAIIKQRDNHPSEIMFTIFKVYLNVTSAHWMHLTIKISLYHSPPIWFHENKLNIVMYFLKPIHVCLEEISLYL